MKISSGDSWSRGESVSGTARKKKQSEREMRETVLKGRGMRQKKEKRMLRKKSKKGKKRERERGGD